MRADMKVFTQNGPKQFCVPPEFIIPCDRPDKNAEANKTTRNAINNGYNGFRDRGPCAIRVNATALIPKV